MLLISIFSCARLVFLCSSALTYMLCIVTCSIRYNFHPKFQPLAAVVIYQYRLWMASASEKPNLLSSCSRIHRRKCAAQFSRYVWGCYELTTHLFPTKAWTGAAYRGSCAGHCGSWNEVRPAL